METNSDQTFHSQQESGPQTPPSQTPPPFPAQPNQPSLNDKLLAALSYFGILIIIPFLLAREKAFVKFHLRQGLVLVVGWIVYWLLVAVLGRIPVIGWINYLFSPLVALGFLILIIVGVINSINGEEKELPLLGEYGRKFNI
jgi:uncharacterized membrane protein